MSNDVVIPPSQQGRKLYIDAGNRKGPKNPQDFKKCDYLHYITLLKKIDLEMLPHLKMKDI